MKVVEFLNEEIERVRNKIDNYFEKKNILKIKIIMMNKLFYYKSIPEKFFLVFWIKRN